MAARLETRQLRRYAPPPAPPHTEPNTLSARTTRKSLNPGFTGPSPCHSRDCLKKTMLYTHPRKNAQPSNQKKSPPRLAQIPAPSRARFWGHLARFVWLLRGIYKKNRLRRGPPTMVAGGPRSQSVRACGAKQNPWLCRPIGSIGAARGRRGARFNFPAMFLDEIIKHPVSSRETLLLSL